MDWNITEINQLTPPDIDRQGNKLLMGNGYIGYRGTLEEFNKEQKTATIVSGLYDKVGGQWREPVNLPNGSFIEVTYKGKPLHARSHTNLCINIVQVKFNGFLANVNLTGDCLIAWGNIRYGCHFCFRRCHS